MKRENMLTGKSKNIFMLIKYITAVFVTVMALYGSGSAEYFIGSLLELSVIFFMSNLLVHKWPKSGYVINSLVMLMYLVQQLILYYGQSYLTMIMLNNTDSIQDLGGRALEYGIVGITVLVCSFLPISYVEVKHVGTKNGLITVLVADLLFTLCCGNAYSPLYGYINVGIQAKAQAEREEYIRSQPDMAEKFYQKEVNSGTAKPADLVEKPNVILIMTEGLSQSIVEDEREIMPNVKEYEEKSLFFDNYYNHTAATYRGIIGQLYSGYQYDNLDVNHLVSLQDIFKEEGYYTSFVNTEENNTQFTQYLESMNFDDVLGKDTEDWLTDKEAYEFLWDTVEEESENDEPFFTAIYTFNTHLTFDSEDEKFEDGSDAELNKFYNCDYQFGEFMKKFRSSDLSDNTIIVFTADHCTYADDAFTAAFPETERTYSFCDRIPLFIYYKGIEADTIDAEGRNSLCLAPTILDFLDVTEENYFLGTSLFLSRNNDASDFDTIYTEDNSIRLSTADGIIQEADSSIDSDLEKKIDNYFAAAQQERE